MTKATPIDDEAIIFLQQERSYEEYKEFIDGYFDRQAKTLKTDVVNIMLDIIKEWQKDRGKMILVICYSAYSEQFEIMWRDYYMTTLFGNYYSVPFCSDSICVKIVYESAGRPDGFYKIEAKKCPENIISFFKSRNIFTGSTS